MELAREIEELMVNGLKLCGVSAIDMLIICVPLRRMEDQMEMCEFIETKIHSEKSVPAKEFMQKAKEILDRHLDHDCP